MTTVTERVDTRMMGIVHGTLRRDLLRTRAAVTTEPYPHGRQRGRALNVRRLSSISGFRRGS